MPSYLYFEICILSDAWLFLIVLLRYPKVTVQNVVIKLLPQVVNDNLYSAVAVVGS